MVASLLLSLVDPLDRPIDFESLGGSVPEVARQLSNASELKIKAGPSVKAETLIVNVHDMPIRKLLDHVSSALLASWKQEAGEVVIYRTDKQEREQAAAERKAILHALKKWQDTPLPAPFTDENARSIVERVETATRRFDPRSGLTAQFNVEMNALAKEAPGYRGSIYLRKIFDLNMLADVKKGRRIVFSSRPGRLQKPLKNGEAVLDRFAQEMAVMQPFAAASVSRVPETDYAMDVRRWPAGLKGRPDRVLAAAYRIQGIPMLGVRTYFVSGNQIVGWVSDTINPDPSEPKLLPPAKFSIDDALVKLTQNPANGRMAATGLALVKSKTEPAGWIVGPLLDSYAKARKLDLVASVADGAINMSMNMYLDGKNDMPGLNVLTRRFFDWTEKDGVLVISPKTPVQSRAETFDRARFWDLSAMFLGDGRPRLETVADYLAQESVEPVHDNLLSRMALWTTGVQWNFGFWGTSPILRFWGRMPASSRISSVTVGQLTPGARVALDDWIFGTNLALQAIEVDPEDRASGMDIRRLEPTERFSEGLPSELPLMFRIEDNDVIWQTDGENPPWSDRLDFAYTILDSAQPVQVRVAHEKQRLWKMFFNNDTAMRVEIDEPTSPAGMKMMSPKDLPAGILDRLRAAEKKYKSQTSTVRGTPPP